MEWALIAKTLVVLLASVAHRFGDFHLYTEMFCSEFDSGQNCQVGVAFAAARTAVFTDVAQCFGSHQVAEAPWFFSKWGRFGRDGNELTGADTCTASTQNPQVPPGTALPRRYISKIALSKSTLPPAFL